MNNELRRLRRMVGSYKNVLRGIYVVRLVGGSVRNTLLNEQYDAALFLRSELRDEGIKIADVAFAYCTAEFTEDVTLCKLLTSAFDGDLEFPKSKTIFMKALERAVELHNKGV